MCDFYITQTDDAKDLPLPSYMTEGSAGMDLFANVHEPAVIKPGEIKLIPTGIRIALPRNYEAQIRPRSGLALKHGISLVNSPGTVDSDYRGVIGVIAINHGKEAFTVNRGERIAQMVVNKVERMGFKVTEDLDTTGRGDGGFGHTGV